MQNRQTSSSRSGSQYREERSSRSGSRTDRAGAARSNEARAGSARSPDRSGSRGESARGRGSRDLDVRDFRERDMRGACSERQTHGERHGHESARAKHDVRSEQRGRESACAARSYSEGGNRTSRNSDDFSSRRGGSTREREVHVGSGNRGFSPRKGQGIGSSWMADRVASSSLPVATVAPVLCIVVVVLIAIFLVTSIGSCVSSANNSSQGDASQTDQMEISYTPLCPSHRWPIGPGNQRPGHFPCQFECELCAAIK